MTTPSTRYNWPAAFLAYCNNCPVDEIAQIFGMELNTLQLAISRDGWARLKATLPSMQESVAKTPTDGELKLRRIQENREKNLKVWLDLRDDLINVVGQLKDGKLKMEKLFFSAKTCMVVREEIEPTMGDRVNLATYARTIAEGTYRALGDITAQEKAGQDHPAGGASAVANQITIILPGVIAAPRNERAINQVIDLANLPLDVPSSPPTDAGSPGNLEPALS